MHELDRIDSLLLAELDKNSRQHLSSLAKKLHLGRDLVQYRIDKLKKEGVIRKFYMHLDPCKLGLTFYKMYLRLARDAQLQKRLVSFLESQPSVHWVGQCGGSWDIIFAVCFENPNEFYDFQNVIFSKFCSAIIDSDVAVIVKAGSFSATYSLGIAGRAFLFGEGPSHISLDKLEQGIISHLCHDTQLDIAVLAKRVKSSTTTVRSRIEKLEKLGFIRGYRVDIDTTKIGLNTHKAQLFLAQHSAKLDQELWAFCEKHPKIEYLVYQLGHAKVEIEVGATDYLEYERVIEELEEAFPKVIHSTRSMIVYSSQYRWSFSETRPYIGSPA